MIFKRLACTGPQIAACWHVAGGGSLDGEAISQGVEEALIRSALVQLSAHEHIVAAHSDQCSGGINDR